MFHLLTLLTAASVLAITLATPAYAEEAEPAKTEAVIEQQKQTQPQLSQNGEAVQDFSETLTGDWGGLRSRLLENGISVDAAYKLDLVGNGSGGVKRGARVLDNLDLIIGLDGEKLIGSHGTTGLVYLLNNNGGHPDVDLFATAQGVNNIEVPEATGKIFQAWVQQAFLDDRVALLGGLYAADSEFEVTDSSAIFIHSTFGLGTDIAQSGVNSAPSFPFGALGGRLKVKPVENVTLMAAVLDGVPGDPTNPRGTQAEWHGDDGSFLIAEADYKTSGEDEVGKIGIGAWRYTHPLLNPVDGSKVHSDGVYALGEQQLYSENGNDPQGLSAFARLGTADGRVNDFDYAYSAGVTYIGLIPGRDEGISGLAIHGAVPAPTGLLPPPQARRLKRLKPALSLPIATM